MLSISCQEEKKRKTTEMINTFSEGGRAEGCCDRRSQRWDEMAMLQMMHCAVLPPKGEQSKKEKSVINRTGFLGKRPVQ